MPQIKMLFFSNLVSNYVWQAYASVTASVR